MVIYKVYGSMILYFETLRLHRQRQDSSVKVLDFETLSFYKQQCKTHLSNFF